MIGSQTFDPAEFPNVFKANFDAKLIDAIVSGYAEDGVLELGGGYVLRDRNKIRLAIANLLAPGGSHVEMYGNAVDVLRREDDRAWRPILDLPFGHGTPSA